uniref:Uncharacterized protein n=1 Tax=Leersia perrieri TaxID=77586 RepID=A0A0D9WSE8_9ORYZ
MAWVRTWVIVVALALAMAAVVEAQEEVSVAAATAAISMGAAIDAKKPKCKAGETTGAPCRVGAVHDPENQEEEGLFNMRARAPAVAPSTDGDGDDDDDYSDPDLSHDDDLVVLGH